MTGPVLASPPMSPAPTRIILHGAKPLPPTFRAALRELRDAGFEAEIAATWEAGDAGRFVREARALGVEHLIAAGGDGTLNQVVTELVRAPWPGEFGIIPMGTANDFATSAGLPVTDVAAALRAAVETPAVPVDVVRGDGRAFLNVATGGFGTRITTETSESLKAVIGKSAYVLTGLTRPEWLAPQWARVRGEAFEWEGWFLALALGNGRAAGGGVQLCPAALIDDGQLQVTILESEAEQGFAGFLEAFVRDGLDSVEGDSIRRRTPWVEITPRDGETLVLNLDGEPHEIRGRTARFEVVPGALRLRLPAGCPMLQAAG